MKPLKNYILVVDAGVEKKTTESGIILTETIETGSKPGFVIAIGPDVVDINKTDSVALDWGKGMPITVKGEKAILISEDFVYGIY